MHRLHLLWPLLILAAATCWLLSQAGTVSRLETGNADLRAQLAARTTTRDGSAMPRPRPTKPTALDADPRDWSRVAAELRDGKLIAGVLPTNLRLRAALLSMDAVELQQALDEIAAAGLLTADRERLDKYLAGLLIKRDPGAGFSRFCTPDYINWGFYLGARFRDWFVSDSTRAIAWLQQHIAEGGKVPDQMINDPFFSVLREDPALAASVLTALPEKRRLESLRCLNVGRLHKPDGQKQWAQVVRNHLPEADGLKAIAWPLGNWSDGDGSPMLLPEVDAYLQRIDATPAEQLACILQVATQQRSWRDSQRERPPFAEGLERMQAWVAGHSPERVTEATLQALEHAAQFSKFADASTVALQLHEETGDQAYLHAVLKDVHRIDQHENVRVLLDRITDPARIEQYQKQIR